MAVVVENLEQIQVESGAANIDHPPQAPTQEEPQDQTNSAETGKQQQDAPQ